MLHVAVLFEFPTRNGGENSMLALLRQLSGSDFQFTAIAPADGPLADELRRLKIPLVPFCVRAAGVKRSPEILHTELTSIVKNIRPDILHANSLSMARLTGQLNLPDGVARTGHLRDIIKLNRTVIADLNSNDGLIAVSAATKQFHVRQGLNSDHCRVIHNGIDGKLFAAVSTDRQALRAEFFPNVARPTAQSSLKIILNVGQICLRKGQLLLAEAVCRLLERRDDIALLIVGERHSAKKESVQYEQQIRQTFADAGRDSHLHLTGYRTDIADVMNASDVLVQSSHQEPFGRVLLEAAASQLPIVATDVGGTAEMLHHNDHALLVPPASLDELTEAIAQTIDASDEAVSRAISAQDRIVQQFDIRKTVQQTAEFWQQHG